MQMHGPRSPREPGPRPPLADQGQDVRGAAPGVPDHLRAAHPRARAGDPRSGAALRRRPPRSGATPSPTGPSCGSVVTNHGPMSEQRLAFRRLAREETRWVREADPGRAASPHDLEALGGDAGARALGGLPPGAGRRPDAPRRQRHGARRRARRPLRPRAVRPAPGERPAVGRPPRRHRRPRRPGPAPAAARSLVQEARRLRHARQAGRRARGRRPGRSRRPARDERRGPARGRRRARRAPAVDGR